MTDRPQPLIVGAGPAGVRAAEALVAAGLRPVVVDEGHACGGQIYRQPLVPDGRSARARYGSEAAKAERLHRDFAALIPHLDYLPGTLVWNLRDGLADVSTDGQNGRLRYQGAILATGATDRILPVPGWTLPGVFSLGGAQIALKAQGCAVGRRVVFAGTGPLLYLVAWQYMKAGVEVAAVLDAAPRAGRLALMWGLASFPAIVMRGARFVAELTWRGVPIHHAVTELRFEGERRLSAVSYRAGGKPGRIACDGAGYGLALRSETQLADLAGCRFAFDERDRAWLPETDVAGRTGVANLYIAGDGAGIAGADAAELAGERAALAMIEDRGLAVDHTRARLLDHELSRIMRFRDLLERAFPFPAHWLADCADRTLLCRCEEVDAGGVRDAAARFGVTEINRLKAVSRIGMGRCQGRICGVAAVEVLAAITQQPLAGCGRLRAQAPIKPIALAASQDQ